LYGLTTVDFSLPQLQQLLGVNSATPSQQAKLDNLACEERVSDFRRGAYEDFLRDKITLGTTFADNEDSWLALHDRYVRQHVVIRDSAAFLQSSELTTCARIAEEDTIIRVERIDTGFRKWEEGTSSGKSAVALFAEWANTLHTPTDPVAPRSKVASGLAALGQMLGRTAKPSPSPTVRELFAYWNNSVRTDHRPSFVAFEAELADDLAAPDWPERLCVRLGLGHHFSGGKVTLALLRYRVRDALDAYKMDETRFCAPTVLDSPFGEYFHPAPRGCDWGFAAVLDAAANDGALVSELLHRRIDYHPEQLLRVGTVNRLPVGDADLVALRNAHVGRLRRQSGRDDFGTIR
jgi:hypothetical protein